MTGNKTIDNIILILSLLATSAALGVFVYSTMIYKRPLPKDAEEFTKLKEDNKDISVPQSYKLDPIIVNIPSKTRRLRFLDVQAHIVVFKQNQIASLEEKKALINDIVIDVASNMQPDELNSIAGKLIFENRIKKRINGLYKKQPVKELFYTKFVVQ